MAGDDLQPGAPAGAADDELARRGNELRTEMMKVNSGSKREAELQQELNSLYQRHAGTKPAAVLATPRPDGYTTLPSSAPPRDFAAERLAIRAEMQQPFADPNLQDKLDESYRDEDAALVSAAPEPPPSPDALTWPDGTPDPIKRSICAIAFEEGYPSAEVQGVVDRLVTARWLPAAEFVTVMRAEWGDALAANCALADREAEQLHGPLRQRLIEYEANDTRFSPEVAIELVNRAQRRARGGR